MSLASSDGPHAPNASVSTVDATSITGLTFQFTATTSAQYLAAAWTTAHSYTAGQVVVNQGRVYRCTTSGTSAATGNGPLTVGAGIADGTAIWRGVGPFVNGFKVTNTDASIKVYWALGEAASTTIGDAIMPGGGVGMTILDPSLVSVIAASSTVALTIAGLS